MGIHSDAGQPDDGTEVSLCATRPRQRLNKKTEPFGSVFLWDSDRGQSIEDSEVNDDLR